MLTYLTEAADKKMNELKAKTVLKQNGEIFYITNPKPDPGYKFIPEKNNLNYYPVTFTTDISKNIPNDLRVVWCENVDKTNVRFNYKMCFKEQPHTEQINGTIIYGQNLASGFIENEKYISVVLENTEFESLKDTLNKGQIWKPKLSKVSGIDWKWVLKYYPQPLDVCRI